MLRRLQQKSWRGFTLIELMIVVAIISVLSSVAIPNFIKFQTKAKQTEVKVNLKGAYIAAKSKYAEKSTYSTLCLKSDGTKIPIGYTPETNNIYYYYGTNASDKIAATKTGFTTESAPQTGSKSCPTDRGHTWTTGFVIQGASNIDFDTMVDVWVIDTANTLKNDNIAASVSYTGTYDAASGLSALVAERCNDVLW